MNLSYDQFELLRRIKEGAPSSQISADRPSGMETLIKDGHLTAQGSKILEQYRVKRAVLLAAGIGSRMSPVTKNRPKPLIAVNGIVFMEALLDAVVGAGIDEVVIVRGYLAEQFDYLKDKYPHVNIQFIFNPDYRKANNISSIWWARDYLENAYVMEADLLLYNPALVHGYQYRSNYLGVPVAHTDDWCFQVEGDYISEINVGGQNCMHMYGISYWNKQDGNMLCQCVQELYPKDPGLYWDEIALKYYKDRFKIAVRPCSFSDITEIDTLDELAALDASYSTFLG